MRIFRQCQFLEKIFKNFVLFRMLRAYHLLNPEKTGLAHCGTPRNMPQAGKKVSQSLPLCENATAFF